MPEAPRVSVVIRNRNEARHLDLVLAALRAQSEPCEIVVVDNESTDDSVAVAERHGCRVLHLPAAEFTYGRALNVGIAATTHEAVVLLSAHSLPLSRHFLAECVAALDDPDVGAARCLYAAKHGDAVRWPTPARIGPYGVTAEDVVSRGPLASGCVIRRRAWHAMRFDETVAAGEDKLWALRVGRLYTILSPIPAPYAYLRKSGPVAEARKSGRERVAIYRATGLGAVPATVALRDFARDVAIGAPIAFGRAVQLAGVRVRERLTLRLRAARAHRAGPLQ